RNRNLAVSFGILTLLAISMIIIIISARRAQQLARQQMEFVAGVSHEFRTPLSVIHAISENLADGLITDGQQIEQCGVVIRNDVRRLAGMVEQVLEFAGASRGKSLYQPTPVDLTNLIEQVVARYSMSEPQKELRIEKEIEPNLPAVLADHAALTCAVRNIFDNAVKYGGAHNWIGIKAQAQAGELARSVRITIEDKGIGIAPADLPFIFEPFYRGREVLAAQIHGNGLGLSLVKNIIEAHGGTVTVASALGEGSSFTLNLPAAPGEGQLAGATD
ncbi:MAG TPA: HAMP domain-containing sensor histidine kinase, partial [Blastocatellia bacterium]|nr:HAMP domain-containing sensor histidine kinase [Blastocatellia bacterium]